LIYSFSLTFSFVLTEDESITLVVSFHFFDDIDFVVFFWVILLSGFFIVFLRVSLDGSDDFGAIFFFFGFCDWGVFCLYAAITSVNQ